MDDASVWKEGVASVLSLGHHMLTGLIECKTTASGTFLPVERQRLFGLSSHSEKESPL